MTKETFEQRFVRAILPWAVAGVFFLLYLVTLNGWVSITSLSTASKAMGWDWRPTLLAPLHYVLLFPFRWLPGSVALIALNVFSAACAALTLAFLTRSVRLLPHDRTRDQRQREPDQMGVLSLRHSWLPPLAAALLCGLQLTFWESATSISGEMIDLLIFSFLIRCLLEFRVSEDEKWLFRLALVYGIGVTNNWALIACFPAFLIALIWVKGLRFFKLRFLLRMTGWGSLGLLLYLLLPAIDAESLEPSGSFWQALKVNWHFQKSMTINSAFIYSPDLRVDFFRLLLTSVFPLLLISIRWPSFQGDVSPAGDLLGVLLLRLKHLVGLVFMFWIFFDPPFSGRVLGRGQLHFLTSYYLSALVAGYLVGYIMLVFGKTPEQTWQRFSKYFAPVAKLMVIAMWIIVAAVPIALVRKNWASIRATNGPELKRFATAMTQALPPKAAVVLSDDPGLLFLLKAVDQQTGERKNDLLLETAALPYGFYHRILRGSYPQFAKELSTLTSPSEAVQLSVLVQFLDRLSNDYPLYYLHPSFGYYFERFYARPHGLIYELKPYQPNEVVSPALTAEEIAENQKFWVPLQAQMGNYIPRFLKTSRDMQWLGANYSRALNTWGVDLQRAKELDAANACFTSALALNPDNSAAFVNQKWNKRFRTGDEKAVTDAARDIEKKLNQYRTWDSAMGPNGPFDGLSACMQLAQIFKSGGALRQALALYLRALEIYPQNLPARFSIAAIYIDLGFSDKALEQIQILRQSEVDAETDMALLNLEARAYARKNDLKSAEKRLADMFEKRPSDDRTARLLIQFYMEINRLEDAVKVADKQLQADPRNVTALLNKGGLLIQLKQYDKAVPVLDACLANSPDNVGALMNRALANFLAEKYDEARKDYDALEKLKPPRLFAVHYGLAQIAQKKGQTNEVIRRLQLYLDTAPPQTEEYRQVTAQLKELGAAKPDQGTNRKR